jgi:prepilin-type N-terminal cleavage/methylation domain-containing protein
MMTNRFAVVTARHTGRAFTLVEMLVSIAVLTLLLLMITQMVKSGSSTATTGNKHVDTDTQARTVFDRMALDFGQMLKRTDVDYYFKANEIKYPGHSKGHKKGGGGPGGGNTNLNDYIAFYSQVPGYDPSSGSPSPISLVAYRLNGLVADPSYNKLERLGKGLLWNGVFPPGSQNNPNYLKPVVFLPLLIKDTWPAAIDNNSDPDGNYETIGPQVFRFEYYYLLKSGKLNDSPFDNIDAGHDSQWFTDNGLKDVEAIAVTIAVIDPASRSLLTDADLLNLQLAMEDFQTQKGQGPVKYGQVEAQWNQVITDPITYPFNGVPRPALSAIRIYNRYFELKLL